MQAAAPLTPRRACWACGTLLTYAPTPDPRLQNICDDEMEHVKTMKACQVRAGGRAGDSLGPCYRILCLSCL